MTGRRAGYHADQSGLLHTPTMSSTPIARQIDPQASFSTLTISPMPLSLPANSFAGAETQDTQGPARRPNESLLSQVLTAQHGSQVHRLRLWRHDALVQHQHETAAFVADKIWHMTGDPNDAFWLAQTYFDTGHFARAQSLLQRSALLQASVACRHLAAQCLMERWSEALELLGELNPFSNVRNGDVKRVHNTDGGIKLEASMCYLRGLVFSNVNNLERAKQCFQEALTIDAKCYEAFDQLFLNTLMTPQEELDFMANLSFAEIASEDVPLIEALYKLRLSKYRSSEQIAELTKALATKFSLKDNTDVLLAEAELLFTQCRFKESLTVSKKILALDPYKFGVVPLHLTCLHELGQRNELFLLSNDMVERHPEEPSSWLAVGVYYMSIGKVADARRHFSKASVMNPRFGPAWIGFAHSFASEGEHDQAISAYTTAARLFQGTHLPSLFLGMQHLQLNNIVLADEYLNTAYEMCNCDPLLLNELGVVCFHKGQLDEAIGWFEYALEVAEKTGSHRCAWTSTHANLGHACRRLRRFDEALTHFDHVARLSPLDPTVYTARGTIYLHLGRFDDAVTSFHQALSLKPHDALVTDLLERALQDASEQLPSALTDQDEADVDVQLDHLMDQAEALDRPPDATDVPTQRDHDQMQGTSSSTSDYPVPSTQASRAHRSAEAGPDDTDDMDYSDSLGS